MWDRFGPFPAVFRPETANNDFYRYSFWKRLSGCRLRLVVKFDPSTRKAPLVRPKKRCGRARARVVVVAGVKPDKNNIVYVSTGRISYPGRSRLTSASAEDRAATRPNEPFGLKSRFAAQNAASRPCRASHGPFGPAHRFAMLGARSAREK